MMDQKEHENDGANPPADEHEPHQAPCDAAEGGKGSRAKRIAVIVGIAVVLLAIAFGVWRFAGAGDGFFDLNAQEGQAPYKTPEEIQAELDRIVEEGMFNISIASTVQLEDGASDAELRIENVPNNPYLMKVELARDDTGDTIYTSGMIEPNHHIQKAKLDVDLDAGEYPCTAVFYAYDKQSEQLVGQAAAKLTVLVQS